MMKNIGIINDNSSLFSDVLIAIDRKKFKKQESTGNKFLTLNTYDKVYSLSELSIMDILGIGESKVYNIATDYDKIMSILDSIEAPKKQEVKMKLNSIGTGIAVINGRVYVLKKEPEIKKQVLTLF